MLRTHPAIIAQAAATIATLSPIASGSGVGTAKALNEHIFGDAWPRPASGSRCSRRPSR